MHSAAKNPRATGGFFRRALEKARLIRKNRIKRLSFGAPNG